MQCGQTENVWQLIFLVTLLKYMHHGTNYLLLISEGSDKLIIVILFIYIIEMYIVNIKKINYAYLY